MAGQSPRRNKTVPGDGSEEGRQGVQASSKKMLGAASLLLGLFAWLGEKLGLITRQTSDWLNFGSAVTGAIATFA